MTAVPIVRVGDICEQIRGVTYSKADAVTPPREQYLPVLRANNITEFGLTSDGLVYIPEGKVSGKQKVRKNDVVIAASSGSLDVVGKAARSLADFDGGFGAFCKVLRPSDAVDAGYFAQYFQTKKYRQKVSSLAAGANINNLRNEHLNELEIPLPPLPEQRRIAAILDKADALRAKRREAIAKLDQLLQSVFLDMFGDPVTNPKGWAEVPVGSLAERITKGESPKWQGFEYCDDGVRFITSENVGRGRMIRKDKFIPSDFDDKICRSRLKSSDLLINLVGASIGRLSIMEDDLLPANINQAVATVTLDRTRISVDFVMAMLLTPSGQNRLLGGKVDAARANISLKNIRDLVLPLPPLPMQRRFEQLCGVIRHRRMELAYSGSKQDELLASLQQRAFSGQLSQAA